MKRNFVFFKLVSLFLLALIFAVSLVGCNEPDTGSDEESLCLVNEGRVNFQVVISSELDIKGKKQVSDFIGELRELGLSIPEAPVSDNDKDLLRECEIVFGTNVKNRDGCSVDEHEIGKDGYVIKVVGDRVIVAAGSDEALSEAIDVLKKKVFEISKKTETLEGVTVTVKRAYTASKSTEYPIASVQIADKSLDSFCLSFDEANPQIKSAAGKLRQAIYEKCGIWLPLEHELSAGQSVLNKLIIRAVDNLGSDNFKVYLSESSLLIETTAPDRMNSGVEAFLEKYFSGKSASVRFYSDDVFTYDVVALRYSEYGAVGDGVTDDFEAIIRTHQAANQIGVKVMADDGATYYLGPESYGKTATIATNVDWCGASFIVDDMEINPMTGHRGGWIFNIPPSEKKLTYEPSDTPDATSFAKGLNLSVGDTSLPDGLRHLIKESCIVVPYDKDHQIFVRYGANTGTSDAHELLLVNADGTIDPSTPVMWDYSGITKVEIIYINDDPITVENGRFTTYANQEYKSFTEQDLANGWATGSQYYYFSRGLNIKRSHVTVKRVEHYIKKEGAEGYPYNGFYSTNDCYDVLYENCVMTGHKHYTTKSNGTGMGSYDMSVTLASNVTFKGCVQSNDITDKGAFWSVMCGNFHRNLVYNGCTLASIDAHQGGWNVSVLNTTLGHSVSMIGGGELIFENTTKLAGNEFISFRSDYGSLWRGNVTLKNCKWDVKSSAVLPILSGTWNEKWIGWDFGYPLSMPQNITVDNFVANNSKVVLLSWKGLSEKALTSANAVKLTKTVTVMNQSKALPLANTGDYLYALKSSGVISVTGAA